MWLELSAEHAGRLIKLRKLAEKARLGAVLEGFGDSPRWFSGALHSASKVLFELEFVKESFDILDEGWYIFNWTIRHQHNLALQKSENSGESLI